MIIKTINSKNLLTSSKLPEADFVINPYVGCNHGCVYCYAQYMSRFTGHTNEAWGDFIDIKECDNTIPLKKISGKSIFISSTTDPYIPTEKKCNSTRNILKQLESSDAKIEILTKSPLVIRDIDIFKNIKNISVGMSFTSMDKNFVQLVEKNTASPEKRLEALKILKEAGISTFAFISPIFPFFSDYRDVVNKTSPYVDLFCFENLNLRGNYKYEVLKIISENFPDYIQSFYSIYSSRENFNQFWTSEEEKIRIFMKEQNLKKLKIYFFHENIKKK